MNMKKLGIILLLSVLCIFAGVAKSSAKEKTLENCLAEASKELALVLDKRASVVAVVDINSGYSTLDEYIVEEMKHNLLENLAEAVIVERDERTLSLIKAENTYQESGAVSDDTIQDVGSALGADCLLFGTLTKTSDGYQLLLRAVSVESKKVLASYKGSIAPKDSEIAFQIRKSKHNKSASSSDLLDPALYLEDFAGDIETVVTQFNTDATKESIVDAFIVYITQNFKYTTIKQGEGDKEKHFISSNLTFNHWAIDSESLREGNLAWGVYTAKSKNTESVYLVTKGAIFNVTFDKKKSATKKGDNEEKILAGLEIALAQSAQNLKSAQKIYEKEDLLALEKLTQFHKKALGIGYLTYNILSDVWRYYTNFKTATADPKVFAEMCLAAEVNEDILINIILSYRGPYKMTLNDQVKFFLEHGADVNDNDEFFYTPLIAALSDVVIDNDPLLRPVILQLIKAGADVNVKDDLGITPFFEAIDLMNRDNNMVIDNSVIIAMIKAGANVNEKDKYGETPLYRLISDAVYNEKAVDISIVSALIKAGADVNVKDDHGTTLLHLVIDGIEDNGFSYFDSSLVSLLTEAGADVNVKHEIFDETPLQRVLEIAIEHYRDVSSIVSALIKAKANVNVKDEYGQTPLMLAIVNNDSSIVSALIKAGANVNAKDEDGHSVLEYAKHVKRPNAEIIDMLKKAGAK